MWVRGFPGGLGFPGRSGGPNGGGVYTALKLTASSPRKIVMVGRDEAFPFGAFRPHFQGRTAVGFRECNLFGKIKRLHKELALGPTEKRTLLFGGGIPTPKCLKNADLKC